MFLEGQLGLWFGKESVTKNLPMLLLHRHPMLARSLFQLANNLLFDVTNQQLRHIAINAITLSRNVKTARSRGRTPRAARRVGGIRWNARTSRCVRQRLGFAPAMSRNSSA